MRFLLALVLIPVASCSWMPALYPREHKEVAIPLVPAPDPEMDKAQRNVSPENKQNYIDPMAVNQMQYQLQSAPQMVPQMVLQAPAQIAPQAAQPQYYYAIPAQPQQLSPQYQQPYYQQPVQQPIQPQIYAIPAPAPVPAPPLAAPMLGQTMPHTFTTGSQFLSNDAQKAPGEDDFPDEYGHVKSVGEQKDTRYIKRDDLDGQQTQIQPSAPPLIGQQQQIQGR